MAKFGIEQTGLGAPGLGGAGNIAPGVEDRSSAISVATTTGLIANVGELGKGLYAGKQIADIEVEQEKIIQEYMDRRSPEQLKIEAASLDTARASLFMQGVSEEEVNPITAKFREATGKYQRALEQGTMSPTEFTDRTLSTLRNAVNKNPGLMKELSEQANKILELSGISSIIKQDESDRETLAKTQEKQLSELRSLGDKLDIPFDRFNTDYYKLQKDVQQVQEEKSLLAAADRQNTFTEEQFKSFGSTYAVGKINVATDMALQILNDPSIPYDKAIFSINNLMDSIEKEFVSDPRIGRVIDKPSVQATHTFIKNQVATIKENIKKFASKEEAAAYIKNSTNMLRDQQYQDISKVVNPQSLEVLSKLIANVGIADFISKHTELKVQLVNGISKLVDGLPTNGTELYSRGEGGARSVAVQTINSLAVDAGREGGDKDVETLSKVISSINIDSTGMSDPVKFKHYEDYIKALGSPTNKMGIAKIGDVARIKATENLDEYVTMTLTDFSKVAASYEAKGISVDVDVLPDGRISITSNDPRVSEELTKKYAIRINDGLAAFSNLTNSSSSVASSKFYSQYASYFGASPTAAPVTEKSLTSQELYAPTQELAGQLVVYTKDIAKKYGKVLSKADDAIFGAWRELVADGLLAESEYRKRVRAKMGIKNESL